MSHYVMYETTVTRHNFDVAMMPDGSILASEVTDAIQAAWAQREPFTRDMQMGTSVTAPRVMVADDDMIRIYFDITERK